MMARVALKDGLFTASDPREARLIGARCGGCGRINFPAQTICPYCSADGCESVALSTRGELQLCTTVVNRPPGYEGPLPFGFGVVELPEGIRLITRVTHPERVRPGQPVRLTLEPLFTDVEGREVVTYAFEPLAD